jgi:hypothetical protein
MQLSLRNQYLAKYTTVLLLVPPPSSMNENGVVVVVVVVLLHGYAGDARLEIRGRRGT